MNSLIYLLQVNLYLVLFYGFYALLLQKETFFKLNRVYLVGSAFLSFLIPVIQSGWVSSLFVTQQVRQVTQAVSVVVYDSPAFTPGNEIAPSGSLSDFLPFIYFSGLLFFLGRLTWQLVILYKPMQSIKQSAKAYSFFRKVVVSEDIEERETIYSHEKVHAVQYHSADIIFFEIIAAINWFNPIVYVYKKAIRHIHEFIADEEASRHQPSKSDYALLLVSNAFGINPNQLVNNFHNQSLLKRRIFMLHQSKSTRTMLLKYCLSAPLFVGMLVFSSATMPVKAPIEQIANEIQEVTENSAVLTGNALRITPQSDTIDATKKEEVKSGQASVKEEDTTPYDFAAIEMKPQYPGGDRAFQTFFSRNFHWPAEAFEKGANGQLVVQFIVEKNGSLTNMRVVKGLGMGIEEEASRVLAKMPNWMPGVQNGRPVRVAFTLPIRLIIAAKSNQNNGSVTETKPEAKENLSPLVTVIGYSNGVTNQVDTVKEVKVDEPVGNRPVYDFAHVDTQPRFPGGEKAFQSFLHKEL